VGFVTTSQSDGLTVVGLERPPANAMTLELMSELLAAFEQVAADPPAALVIAGREGFFSGGVDLKEVPGYDPSERQQMVSSINAMVLSSYCLRCPVVAAITGHAIGGGLVLALCADYRVASLDGRYGLTEVKVGVGYPQAAIGVVQEELSPHAARRLALGSQLIDARDCLALGAFDEVLPAGDVTGRALEVARELAAFPQEVYARTKYELRGAALSALRERAENDPLLAASTDKTSGPEPARR
jgi:enoyl-CoA hydratase